MTTHCLGRYGQALVAVLLIAILICGGCGKADYDRQMEARIQELRAATPAPEPDENDDQADRDEGERDDPADADDDDDESADDPDDADDPEVDDSANDEDEEN